MNDDNDSGVIKIPPRPPRLPNQDPCRPRQRSRRDFNQRLVMFVPSSNSQSYRLKSSHREPPRPVPEAIRRRALAMQPRHPAAGVGFRADKEAKRLRKEREAENAIVAAVRNLRESIGGRRGTV